MTAKSGKTGCYRKNREVKRKSSMCKGCQRGRWNLWVELIFCPNQSLSLRFNILENIIHDLNKRENGINAFW